MTGDPVSRLVEDAVPAIPDELRRPPLREVRARVRRRRARRTAIAAALVTAALVTGPALWHRSRLSEPPRPPSASEVLPTTAPVDSKVTWSMARLDRTGTNLTLYVTRPPDEPPCDGTWILQSATAMGPDEVTVAVLDRSKTGLGCGGGDSLTPLSVTLSAPLGDRPLLDGYDGTPRPVYRESDLPEVPRGLDGWSEVPTTFGAGATGEWGVSYTRPGGPDIRITGSPPEDAPSVDADPIDTVDVAGTRGTIYPHPDATTGYELRWEAPGVVYFLQLLPREGERITQNQFRDVLARLDIS